MKNSIQFKVQGRYAMFTDPVTRIGGEKCSYHVPTYEALKGIVKSIYWKPTFIWFIDRVRIVRHIQTQTKGVKPLEYGGGNSLAFYTYLKDVEYQVEAHFEWNLHRPELAHDRIDGKHHQIARRMLEKGGRQDVFLGVRDCQGYVEPCEFGCGAGAYDSAAEIGYSLMFHGFHYPDESGVNELRSTFWSPIMKHGVIEFPRPETCKVIKVVRAMTSKVFTPGNDFSGCDEEGILI